ncbi:MAG: SGNH/GDSL hydrolase family protein [Chloroflexota bacterium]
MPPSFPAHSILKLVPGLALLSLGLLLSACGAASAPSPKARPSAVPTEPSLAPPRPGAYAALGASETYGVGAEPHTSGYAWLVARGLRVHYYVNVGIPGTTLSAGYDSELPRALTIRPILSSVFFGVNDILAGVTREAFLSDLSDLVGTLRRAHSRVLIIGMPDLSQVPAVRRTGIGGLRDLTLSWNRGMRRVAQRRGAVFLDLVGYDREIAAHPGYISPDGLHPSNAGYARLSQVVLQTIERRRLWRGA